jgi:hypothetical protein
VRSVSVSARVKAMFLLVVAGLVAVGSACGGASESSASDVAPPAEVGSIGGDVAPTTVVESLVATTISGLSDGGSAESSTTVGDWLVDGLVASSADGRVEMVERDGEVWLARQVDDGRLVVSIVGTDGVRDVELDVARPLVRLEMTSTPAGIVVVASAHDDFVPHVWISVDGERWSASTITPAPVVVAGVVWVNGRFIASGGRRLGDLANSGPSVPALFMSADGLAWSEINVDDPFFAREGTLEAPAVVGDRVLVPVQFSGASPAMALFDSIDAGATWNVVDDEGPAPFWLTSVGDLLVGIGAYDPVVGTELALVSFRDGRWEPVDLDPLTGPSEYRFAYPLGSDRPVFGVGVERPSEYCYEEADCPAQHRLVVIVDESGTPTSIDLRVPDAEAIAATIGDDGTLRIALSTPEGVELRSWPTSQGPPPTLTATTVTEPSGPPFVEWGATLQVGETYRYILNTHCGIDVLGRFNDQTWWLVETVSTWPVRDEEFVLGEIHVVSDRQIDYNFDGLTLAVYEPGPEEFPYCA